MANTEVIAVGSDGTTIVKFKWKGNEYRASEQKLTILEAGVVVPTSPRLSEDHMVTFESMGEEVTLSHAIRAPDVADAYLDVLYADDPTELDLYDPDLGRGPDGEVLSR